MIIVNLFAEPLSDNLFLLQLRDQIIENYEQRRTKPDVGYLCDADYNIIKNWRWDSNITGNYDEFLTVQGWNDEKFLAKQYQRILPNVLENVHSSDKFLVNITTHLMKIILY